MKTYLSIFYYNLITIVAYPYELLITVLQPLIEISFLSLFWTMIARSSGAAIDLKSIVAYFIMVEFVGIWALDPGSLSFASYLGYRVKTGILSNTLIRPVSVLPTLFTEQRGYYGVDFIFSLVLLLIAIFLSNTVNTASFAWFIIFLVLSGLITFSFCVFVGSLTFATKEIDSLRHSVSHAIWILSGSLVPLSFFPEKWRMILGYTPFPSMVFAPIYALQNKLSTPEMIFDLKVATIWAIILLITSTAIWNKNVKKYEAIGI